MPSRRVDILTVGEVLVDFVAPDAPDLAHAATFLRVAGGAPANVAVAGSRLGARAALIGAVGQDPFGDYLAEVLQENNVDIAHLIRSAHPTSLAFVAPNTDGIPDFVFYRRADAALEPSDIPGDVVAASAIVHVSSMALMSEPSASATRAAASLARSSGSLLSVDPNLRPPRWPSMETMRHAILPLLASADLLKVNGEEAALLTGNRDPVTALDQLGSDHALAIITRGPDGCLWRWRGEVGVVPGVAVDVAETTGAGDAFVGAVLAELAVRGWTGPRFKLLQRAELEEILHFACAAGALACTQVGAIPALPSRDQVEALQKGGSARIYLTTERLVLRRLTPADVENLVDLDADPDVLRYINGGTPTPRDVMRNEILPRFLQYYDRYDGYGFWAAVERSSGEFLGWFCLRPEDETDPGTASLGYRLRKSAWGKGYATEGARALVRKGFAELGMRRVVATTYEHNIASRRVMEKVGMKLVRTYRSTPEELASGDTFVPTPEVVWEGNDVDYALEKCDWEHQQAEPLPPPQPQ